MAFRVKSTEKTSNTRLLPGVKYEKEAKDEQKREVCPLPAAGPTGRGGGALSEGWEPQPYGFIENAVRFYLGYLDAQDAGIFLPAAIRSCINGRLGTMENRMASLLFKQAVELDMCERILADSYRLDEEYLRRKRAESVESVKRTNGKLRFEQIVRQRDEDEDDEWLD